MDIILVVSNLFILSSDLLLFIFIGNSSLYIVDIYNPVSELYKSLLVPQMTSVSLELYYYLIVPFLLRSIALFSIFFIFSFFIKILFYDLGIIMINPFSYRFFPAELCIFMSGSALYIIKNKLNLNLNFNNKIINLSLLIVLILVSCFFKLFQYNEFIKSYLFLLLLLFCLPFLEKLDHMKFINFLGKLSYPIFLIHMLILNACVFLKSVFPTSYFFDLVPSIFYTILLSIFIEKWLGKSEQTR